MGKKESRRDVWIALIVISLCLLYKVFFEYRTVDADDNPDQQTVYYQDYYITGNRSTRRGFDEADGTDDYFYLLIGNKVDAYDHQGNYDHTLVFTVQRQNGGTSMVCSSDTLYVSTKDNTVHAFRGTEYLGTVTREELNDLPAFLETEGRIYVAKNGIYKACANGGAEYLCPLPDTLARAMPRIPLGAGFTRNISLVVAILFFVVWFGMIFLAIRKERKPR